MIPRWVMGVVAAAALMAALDVGVFVLTNDGTPVARAETPGGMDLVAVIDPAKGRVVDEVKVGHVPTAVVAANGGVVVLDKADGTLTRIDSRSHRVVEHQPLDVSTNDLSVGSGGVWFAGRPRGDRVQPPEVVALERVDPGSGAINRRFDTLTGAVALAAGGGGVWTSGILANHVRGAARSDAATGEQRTLDIGIYGDLIAADDKAAYWVSSVGQRVARVSTRTGLLTASMTLSSDAELAAGHLAPNPTDVAVGGGSLWISTINGTILRVDPQLGGITAAIPACHNALALTYGERAVWVACGTSVVRIDPETDQAGMEIPVEGLPRGIAAADGAVWVTLN